MCIAVPNFIEISQTVGEILHLTILKMTAIHHLGFFKFEYFVDSHGPNMCHLAKFHQNWPNGFGDIAFFDFQDGGLINAPAMTPISIAIFQSALEHQHIA